MHWIRRSLGPTVIVAFGVSTAPSAFAFCSYDYYGFAHGDSCPYVGNGFYRPPGFVAPPGYPPPPPPLPSEQIQADPRQAGFLRVSQQGLDAFNSRNFTQAIHLFREAVKLNPVDLTVKNNLAHALNEYALLTLEKKGKWAEAIKAYKEAEQLAVPGTNVYDQRQVLDVNLQRVERKLEEAKRKQAELSPANSPSPVPTPVAPAPVAATPAASAPAVDAVAGVEPPVPALEALRWSAAFPAPDAQASIAITKDEFDALAAKAAGTRQWLGDRLAEKAEDKAKEAGVDRAVEALPVSAALNNETHWQEALAERNKQLYEEMKADTQTTLVGFMKVTSATIDCIASAASECGAELPVENLKVADLYPDKNSERWRPWLETDANAHLARFYGGEER